MCLLPKWIIPFACLFHLCACSLRDGACVSISHAPSLKSISRAAASLRSTGSESRRHSAVNSKAPSTFSRVMSGWRFGVVERWEGRHTVQHITVVKDLVALFISLGTSKRLCAFQRGPPQFTCNVGPKRSCFCMNQHRNHQWKIIPFFLRNFK